MMYIKTFESHNSKREPITIGGEDMWIDIENSVLYQYEDSKSTGIYFDVIYDGKQISCSQLNKEEKQELLDFLNSK